MRKSSVKMTKKGLILLDDSVPNPIGKSGDNPYIDEAARVKFERKDKERLEYLNRIGKKTEAEK